MKKWFVDAVFLRGGRTYDRGYYIVQTEDGAHIEWVEPIPGGETHTFPLEACTHEDGTPILPEDGKLIGTIASIDGCAATELLELVGEDQAEVIVQEGDISWYVAPYGGKWLSWDDSDMCPHIRVHDAYEDAIRHQVEGAIASGCEDCILPAYREAMDNKFK